jgi:hypothetical protein
LHPWRGLGSIATIDASLIRASESETLAIVGLNVENRGKIVEIRFTAPSSRP